MKDQFEKKSAEEIVSKFYNTGGWKTNELGNTEDADQFEDLREYAQDYISKCRLRVFKYIPQNGENILDMASGPIQYKEYLDYSRNYLKRYCIDLSLDALDAARKKIGDHGIFLHGSFFDMDLAENFFDCSISLHTIYHMDKDMQEMAVRKLLYVTKPGKPVIIVYSNPKTLVSFPNRIFRKIKSILNDLKHNERPQDLSKLYFHPHPLKWWERFQDISDIEILPWRSFGANSQKRIFPNNKFGSRMFKILYKLEEMFPNFFVRNFQYPMIILKKTHK